MRLTRRELLALGATSLVGLRLRGIAPPSQLVAPAAVPQNGFAPDVELEMIAEAAEVPVLPGAPTAVWRYRGRVLRGPAASMESSPDTYLGPTLRLRRGQKVRVHFHNRLPEPSIIHWHGLDVPSHADGHPRLAIPGGERYVYEFEVTNRAGTYWYHPHPHMRTGAQVQRGLAGLLIVSDDDEAALGLPSGAAELTSVLQDRRFDADNQIVYAPTMMEMQQGFLGDTVLVNGKPAPTFRVGARAHRVRVLNGSNARIYKLAWSDGTPMTVLGTDGGLLPRAATQRCVTLAPAQRVDLWVDLGGRAPGARLELRSEAFPELDAGMAMGGMGMGMGAGRMAARGDSARLGAPMSLFTLQVSGAGPAAQRPPGALAALGPAWALSRNAPRRRVTISHARMEWSLAGRTFGMADVAADETVTAGATHVWELVNAAGAMGMQMAHPIHLHGRQFRVVRREGGARANALREGLVDAGWMDTVLVLPGETVSVQVAFAEHPGLYLYHCHILEHEDMGMMRNFRIVTRGAGRA